MPIIPNRNVGPQALRNSFRQPQPWPSLISAKLETLTDDFSIQDATKWVCGGGTSASGGVAKLTTSGGQVDLRTVAGYDFTGSFVYAKVSIGPLLTSGDYFLFNLFPNWGDNNNRFGIEIDPQAGNILLYKNVGGVFTGGSALSYDATSHQWIRLRESGGTFFLDVSPDGANWTSGVRSMANPPFSITSCVFAMDYNHSTGSNTTTVDNLNVQADVFSYRPTVPSNPHVGPQALRFQKRMPYMPSQKQGYTDGADQSISFVTTDDGFVQPGGLMPPLRIPNPFVGPMALRGKKRMPYVGSRQQGYTDSANQTVTFTTSTNGNRGITDSANQTIVFSTNVFEFVQPVGLMPPLRIANPSVGPMALRNQKRRPYIASQRQGYTDSANQTINFATSTDGRRGITDSANTTVVFSTSEFSFVQPVGKMPPLVIPNPRVGPMALRQVKHPPYVPSQRQGHTDGANQTIVFATVTDGFTDRPYYVPIRIPNPFVGPQALRHLKHLPYISSATFGVRGLSDGADTTIVFTTATDGRRGITEGANSTWTFNRSTDGRRGITDTANITLVWTTTDFEFVQPAGRMPPLRIANPNVGPQALRHSKHLPYVGSRRASFTDTANTVIVFTDTPAGLRGIRDGANITLTISAVAAGQRHIFDSANRTITVNVSPNGRRAIRDGASLNLVFTTSDDGTVHPFLIDVVGTVIVGPNEIRSVSVPPSVLSALVTDANTPLVATVTPEAFTVIVTSPTRIQEIETGDIGG